MTTNQTIDGVLVSRELLELAYLELVDTFSWAGELRALLDAPEPTVFGCNRCGGTQAEWSAKCVHCHPAIHPQGEPVAALEKARDVLRSIIRDRAAGVHYASAQAACHQINQALEQPAPVAVVLPERREIGPNYPYLSDLDIEWNACLDELKRLNPSL